MSAGHVHRCRHGHAHARMPAHPATGIPRRLPIVADSFTPGFGEVTVKWFAPDYPATPLPDNTKYRLIVWNQGLAPIPGSPFNIPPASIQVDGANGYFIATVPLQSGE